MAASQKFCLKWNNFQNSVTSVFDNLRQDEELVDITLCCEGKKIKAHRMMLSACSPYFRDLFKDNPCQHPLFFLKDTSYVDIAAVIEFVYKGEVNVLQSQLGSFLKTAEMLQVKGLSGDEDDDQVPRTQPPPVSRERPPDRSRLSGGPPPPPGRPRPRESADEPASPRHKRRRLSGSSDSRPGSPVLVQHVQSAVSAAPLPPPPPPLAGSVSQDPAGDVITAPPMTAALPPPPPPPVSAAELVAPLLLHHDPPPPPQPAAQQDYGIKVEKIDIADDDDDASLEATLGQVSTFEASQFDGSDHSASSNDMAGLLSRVSEQGGSDLLSAAASGEDGASQEPRPTCAVCGRSYKSLIYLRRHEPVHQGTTRCPTCSQVYSTMSNLQQHMRSAHNQPLPEGLTPRSRKQLRIKAAFAAARGVTVGAPPRQEDEEEAAPSFVERSTARPLRSLASRGGSSAGRGGGRSRGRGRGRSRGRGRGRGRPGSPVGSAAEAAEFRRVTLSGDEEGGDDAHEAGPTPEGDQPQWLGHYAGD